jgi:hypothetical protein
MASALSLSLRKERADPRLDDGTADALFSAVRSEIASFAVIVDAKDEAAATDDGKAAPIGLQRFLQTETGSQAARR